MAKKDGFFIEHDGNDPGDSSVWLTVYSDMVTNLMLFFLMLFAMTRLHTASRDRIYAAFKSQFTGAKQVQAQRQETLPAAGDITNISYVEENEEMIKITLPNPVLFDSARADLKDAALPVLDAIIQRIRASDFPVIVSGHTDNDPITGGRYSSNWQLSASRAFSVLNYFITKGEIEPRRLSAMGFGEFRPVASNDSDENKAKNRRIEIIIVKK